MADWQKHFEDLRSEGIGVIALSTDPEEKAKEIVEKDGIGYPIAWGLRVPDDAERVGAAWDEKKPMIQPAELILGPDRKVMHATYSTGPIGRIPAEDALTMIRLLKRYLESKEKG